MYYLRNIQNNSKKYKKFLKNIEFSLDSIVFLWHSNARKGENETLGVKNERNGKCFP